MSAYTDAGTGLKNLFESNRVSRALLKADIYIMFTAVILLIIDSISSIGSLLFAIAFWGFLTGAVLTFANLKNQLLYIGLFGYALANIIWFFRLLFTKFTGFGWFELIAIAISVCLGYLVMKQE